MLAELAAFTAAYKTVKGAVQAGRELASVASAVGQMVQSKDDLQRKLSKKSNSPFSLTKQNDLEEFFALEQIREAEETLRELMIYAGRPGLYQDWVNFSAEARRKRKEAEKQAQKEREELVENVLLAFGIFIGLLIVVGIPAAIFWYFKGF